LFDVSDRNIGVLQMRLEAKRASNEKYYQVVVPHMANVTYLARRLSTPATTEEQLRTHLLYQNTVFEDSVEWNISTNVCVVGKSCWKRRAHRKLCNHWACCLVCLAELAEI
jgi:hypothetical protein